MVGEKVDQWQSLVDLCKNVTLSEDEDKLSWLLDSSGEYSVKSFCSAMQIGEKCPDRFLWKVKIPPRIKTFLCLVLKGSILTRDVQIHRGGRCEVECLFCGNKESINHLFSSVL